LPVKAPPVDPDGELGVVGFGPVGGGIGVVRVTGLITVVKYGAIDPDIEIALKPFSFQSINC
jgi:hypothetical protein